MLLATLLLSAVDVVAVAQHPTVPPQHLQMLPWTVHLKPPLKWMQVSMGLWLLYMLPHPCIAHLNPIPPVATFLPTVNEEVGADPTHFGNVVLHFYVVLVIILGSDTGGPIFDSPSNPFLANPTNTSNPMLSDDVLDQWALAASGDEESFSDASPTLSMVGPPTQRTCGLPQVGWHSMTRAGAATGQAHANATKKKKGACDVWTFFQEMNDAHFCVFCQ